MCHSGENIKGARFARIKAVLLKNVTDSQYLVNCGRFKKKSAMNQSQCKKQV